ncbi:uncharacterized protein LOC144106587 [Amblyomma americanum]
MAGSAMTVATVTLLLLVTLLEGQGVNADESQKCSVGDGIACYWSLAIKYVVRGLLAQLTMEPQHLKVLCEHIALPPLPVCAQYYANCSQEEAALFSRQERAYQTLRTKLMDEERCEELAVLNSCTNERILLGCRMRLVMVPTPESERTNFEAATNFSRCLDDAVKTCTGPGTLSAKSYVKLSGVTLTELFSKIHQPLVSPYGKRATTVAPTSASVTAQLFSSLTLIVATSLLSVSISSIC